MRRRHKTIKKYVAKVIAIWKMVDRLSPFIEDTFYYGDFYLLAVYFAFVGYRIWRMLSKKPKSNNKK